MLYPSQAAAKDLLKQSLGTNPISVVDGMSGAGKSTVVQAAFAETQPGMDIESSRVHTRLAEVRTAVANGIRVVILTPPGGAVSVPAEFESAPRMTVRNLNASELNAWMNAVEPSLQPEERDIIVRYSLGVPLLVERLCKARPITQAAGFAHCVIALQQVIESCHLGGQERIPRLQEVLSRYTDFLPPDDVLPMLADWEHARKRSNAVSILNRRLYQGKEMPVPATTQLFALYDAWIERKPDEPTFDVFVEHAENAEALLGVIGYCQHPQNDTVLSRFIMADARKGATYYQQFGRFGRQMDNRTSDNESETVEAILSLARAGGLEATVKMETIWQREVPRVQLPQHVSPLYVHKHDHTPDDVVPVAYAVECGLQQAGLSYVVRYDKQVFRYDPTTKTYGSLEPVRVDYFTEVYGELPDEGPAPWDVEES